MIPERPHRDCKDLVLLGILLGILWETRCTQIRYSVPEELEKGSRVGDISKHLGLEPRELAERGVRIISRGRTQLFSLNPRSGSLVTQTPTSPFFPHFSYHQRILFFSFHSGQSSHCLAATAACAVSHSMQTKSACTQSNLRFTNTHTSKRMHIQHTGIISYGCRSWRIRAVFWCK